MPITTNKLANGHSSTIVNLLNPKAKTSSYRKPASIDQPDIYDPAFVESENAFLSLIQFFKTSKITSAVFYRFIPKGNLAYKEALISQFSLMKQYAAYFPLLRGLLAFGKIGGLTISSNAHSKTFEIEIHSGHIQHVPHHFTSIFSELLKEEKFKSALKKVIFVQQQAKVLQQGTLDGLYQSLS
jgi:hypothetical protein